MAILGSTASSDRSMTRPARSTSRRFALAPKWLKYMSTPSQSASTSPGSSSAPIEAKEEASGPEPRSDPSDERLVLVARHVGSE